VNYDKNVFKFLKRETQRSVKSIKRDTDFGYKVLYTPFFSVILGKNKN